jgi:ABC-type transport system involved in multi-copper enzyme maturation permease subunit
MMMSFSLAFLAAGSIVWGYDPNGIVSFGNIAGMLSLQALMMVAYTALFTFTSMTMRGTVSAIATNVMCLATVTMALDAISTLFEGTFTLADYWIGWGVSNLTTLTPAFGDVIQGIVIAISWCVVTIVAGATMFKKADVK